MKRTMLVALPLLFSACLSGPNYLSNSVRDARNKSYAESPVGTAFITDVLPVYPLLEVLAAVPDFLVVNPVQFWGFDIWRGRGTGFQHDNPPGDEPSWFESAVSGVSGDRAASPSLGEPVAYPASASKR